MRKSKLMSNSDEGLAATSTALGRAGLTFLEIGANAMTPACAAPYGNIPLKRMISAVCFTAVGYAAIVIAKTLFSVKRKVRMLR